MNVHQERNSGNLINISSKALALALITGSLLHILSITAVGHPPSDMELEYDFDSQILTVTITHTSPAPSSHYVQTVDVYRNDILVLEEDYDSQPDPRTFSYEYYVAAVDGDVLRVTAECNIQGSIESEIVVEGPRDNMYLTVNPVPDEVEMGSELDMTVNIYREEDDMPLDGVSVVPRVDLGYTSEVSELGLGGYAFTYTAPEMDSEDIEVLNLSCTRNGYHPLYFEISFDLVLSLDGSRKIEITIDPWIYTIEEGDEKVFTVMVKAGGELLDIETLDVDYSLGTLSKEKTDTGTFELTYRAAQVDSDTTGFIRVSASREGYVSGERRMEFSVRDIGEGSTQTSDGGGNPYLYIALAAGAGGVLLAAGAGAYLFHMKRRKREGMQQSESPVVYEALEVEEVQGGP